MINCRFPYQGLKDFVRDNAEWISFAFSKEDIPTKYHKAEAMKNGKVTIEGSDYTVDEIESIIEETEGIVDRFSFEHGNIEGYKVIIRTVSGQIIYIKTFEEDFFIRTYNWFMGLKK
jgi:hypothetical protein